MNEQIPWTLLDGGSTVAVKQSELILTWPCGTRMKTSLDQASTNVSWISSHSMRWTLSESSVIWRTRIAIHFPRPCFCTKLCDTWSEPGCLPKIKVIRAWFYYSNNDGLSNPPTFDLHLNGGKWSTVNTASRSGPIYHEIVYSVLGANRRWRGPFYLYLGVYATARCSVPTFGS